jgi:hypothetical protein
MAAHSGSTYMCDSYVRAQNWGNVGGHPGWPNIHRFMYTIDPLLSLQSLVTLMTWSYKVDTALYNCPCVRTHKRIVWYVQVHGAQKNSTCTTQLEDSNVRSHSSPPVARVWWQGLVWWPHVCALSKHIPSLPCHPLVPSVQPQQPGANFTSLASF